MCFVVVVVTGVLIGTCGAVQEELLSDQKSQLHEVYGGTNELTEAVWSWRNADDLQNKLDEVDDATCVVVLWREGTR